MISEKRSLFCRSILSLVCCSYVGTVAVIFTVIIIIIIIIIICINTTIVIIIIILELFIYLFCLL